MQCVGTETNIGQCTHNGAGLSNCNHNEDAGVSCSTRRCRCYAQVYNTAVYGARAGRGLT